MTDWISVADVQAWLGPDVDDTTGQLLADAATSAVRDFLERDIAQATFTEIYDSNGTDYIMLANWPVVSITSVVIDGYPPLVPAAVQQQGYRLDRLVPRKLQFAGYGKLARAIENITVVYEAGYPVGVAPDPASSPFKAGSGLPTAVYTALKLTASAIYNAAAADPNLASENTAGVFSGSFYAAGAGAVPPAARSYLQPYKRVAMG